MKVLSIIIPTYNMEKYLRKCLESLIIHVEEMNSLEVLIINDGSKDLSSQIAHEYELMYPHTFRVVDKENGNYGSCINRGLKEATGKYIKVLDADDTFNSKSLNDFICFLKDHDADMLVTDFQQVYENGKVKASYIFHCPCWAKLDFESYYSSSDFAFLQMHSVTYKRQNLLDINYKQTEGISYTDSQWVFLPISTVKSFFYCPLMLYNYLVGREGQTIDNSVYSKSLKQLMTMTIGRVNMFEDHKLAKTKYESYYIGRLTETIKYIYRVVLLVNDSDLSELRCFDEEIRKISPYLYEKTNDIFLYDKVKIKLIKYWRRNNRQELPALYKFLLKLFNSFYMKYKKM